MKSFFLFIFLFVCVFDSISQSKELLYKQPKEIIVNGKIDSFGFFRYFNQDFLIQKFVLDIKEEIHGDFFFSKEMVDVERNKKFRVVYSFYEYSNFFPNHFDKILTVEQIKSNFIKVDSLSKNDVWKIKNVVSEEYIENIFLLSESDFFEKYISKEGLLINYKNDQEQNAVILRLLQMNILVGVSCVSGDLIIPTHEIGIPVW